ncbi:MAG: cation:proton antiporter [Cyanobacteriota/Melainabacteria group bacterium]
MVRRTFPVFILLLALILGFFVVPGYADDYEYGSVKVGHSHLFMVTDGPAGTPATQRAQDINDVIHEILVNKALDPHKIDTVVGAGSNPSVVLGERTIVVVGDKDSKSFGLSKQKLADKWASILRSRLTQLKPLYEHAKKKPHSSKESEGSKTLSEHRVLLFLLQVAVLLTTACICGELMVRFGQPAVIGQLLAGIVLGPSILGLILPEVYLTLFPPEATQGYLLDIVSWLGVIFLLMLTGTETDVNLIKSQGKRAMATSVGGIILPFLLGFAVAYIIPETMLVLPDQRPILGAFIGTVFSMSSVAIIAKVLIDMKLMRRNVGQIILASALAQDVIGCVILAVVAALASSGNSDMMTLLKVPVGMILFVGLGATVGRKLILDGLRWIHDRSNVPFASISFVAVLLLVSSAITQFIGVHVVLGAFAVGVIIAQSPLTGEKVLHPLEAVTMGIFAPIFFAAAGLHVNLTLLREPHLLLITLLVTLMACVGKIAGSYLGGLLVKMDMWESLSVGFGTNARGAMGLIVGILGFSLGILTVNMFSIIVIMSLATTAMTPFLLGRSLSKIAVSADEQDRLEREEQQSQSFVSKIKRVLIPIRPGSSRQLSSKLIATLGQFHAIEATSLTVVANDSEMEDYASRTLAESSKEGNVTLVNRMVKDGNLAHGILEESSRNYDLVVLEPGSLGEKTRSKAIIESVAKECPCPLVLVREGTKSPDWNIKRILIPTGAEGHTAKAVQLGIVIAKATGAHVTALSVIHERRDYSRTMMQDDMKNELMAHELVDQVAALAGAFDVQVNSKVHSSVSQAKAILEVAEQLEIDLIVVGGNIRPTSQLYFGDVANEILRRAGCHVAVVSS